MECKEGFGCTDQTNRHPGLASPSDKYPYFVIPAQAGIQDNNVSRFWLWIPAFAGMTD